MTIDQLESDAPPTSPASWRQFLIDAFILLCATLVLVGAGYLIGWAVGFTWGTDQAASLVDAFVKMGDSFDRGETGGVIGAIVGAICGVALASWLIRRRRRRRRRLGPSE